MIYPWKYIPVLLFFLNAAFLAAQEHVASLDLQSLPPGMISKQWLSLTTDAFGNPVEIPVLISKGAEPGPTLGITAAIHGNELNGIAIIHQVFDNLDLRNLKGTVVAVPGLNPDGIFRNQREFSDGQDLNRLFPGKKNGNEAQQFVWAISEKLLPNFDLLLDLHTASFGRINSMYVRADTSDQLLFALAKLQQPDIIVHNAGTPSAGATGDGQTLRAEAMSKGIPCITIELGDPQVWQEEMIGRCAESMKQTLAFLGMLPGSTALPQGHAIICKKSYWIYTDRGGLLEVPVALKQKVSKGQLIGILRHAWGEVTCTYHAPEDGVIIGKSTNPAGSSGARIVHLGVEKE